ncbi:hypothetical protein FRC17_001226 [Serendipita sp. 399]|nr:hypothetical protein FRC17_001226 [Serendipita sp. 399]
MSSRATNVHDSPASPAVPTAGVSVVPPRATFIPTTPSSNRHPSAGSIHRVPPEVLMEIFQIYVENGDTPWRLACVCVAWAKIALRTACIWRHIYITDELVEGIYDVSSWSIPGYNEALWALGRKQVCNTQIQMEQAIERARSTPLDVEICAIRGSNLHQQAMLFHVFEQSNVSSRISRLAIIQLPYGAGAFTQLSILPNLEQFVWQEPHDAWVPFMGRLLSQSPKLLSIEVSYAVLSSLSDFDIWGNIRSLTVNYSYTDTSDSDITALDTVIPRCRSLESFKVDAYEIWPKESTSPTTCKRLLSLALNCDIEHLHLIQATTLTWLDITEPEKDGYSEPYINNDMRFPRLETLLVESMDPSWIYKLELPRLRSLSINLVGNNYPNEQIYQGITQYIDYFPANALPTVQDAQFIGHGSGDFFFAAVRSVPNANRITIVQESLIGPAFWCKFVQTMDPQHSEVICPTASVIQLGRQRHEVKATKLYLEPSLRELVVARQDHTTPLHSLKVYWAEEKEYIQYA